MKKIFKNKKLLLIFLSVILLLIVLSSYIKTTEIDLDTIFNQENTAEDSELLFKTDSKNTETKLEADKNLSKAFSSEKEKEQKAAAKKEREIENIALIKEIRDPFQAEAESSKTNESFEKKISESKKLQINSNDDLIFLEKNIIAENIINKKQPDSRTNFKEIELNKNLSAAEIENKNRASVSRQQLENIRLPFKLLGIIKNKDNSAALFLYQGQTLLKKEKEKIDIFNIEEINNKNLIISYQKEKRRLHLWKEKNNEN